MQDLIKSLILLNGELETLQVASINRLGATAFRVSSEEQVGQRPENSLVREWLSSAVEQRDGQRCDGTGGKLQEQPDSGQARQSFCSILSSATRRGEDHSRIDCAM